MHRFRDGFFEACADAGIGRLQASSLLKLAQESQWPASYSPEYTPESELTDLDLRPGLGAYPASRNISDAHISMFRNAGIDIRPIDRKDPAAPQDYAQYLQQVPQEFRGKTPWTPAALESWSRLRARQNEYKAREAAAGELGHSPAEYVQLTTLGGPDKARRVALQAGADAGMVMPAVPTINRPQTPAAAAVAQTSPTAAPKAVAAPVAKAPARPRLDPNPRSPAVQAAPAAPEPSQPLIYPSDRVVPVAAPVVPRKFKSWR